MNLFLTKMLWPNFQMEIKIHWDPDAIGNLRKLEKNISSRIVKKIDTIRLNPERYVLSLVNMNVSKIIVGDYRVFVNYYQGECRLFIRSIKHRRNAYKK